MSRRYADPISVDAVAAAAGDPAPPQTFRWHRRRYRVGTVLQSWIEVGAWWRTAEAVDQEYQLWRVEARPVRPADSATGQFDLCRHRGSGRWFLVRVFD